MISHLSNPYIVTYKNVNKCRSITSLHTKLCRIIDHHILHLSKEKFMLVKMKKSRKKIVCFKVGAQINAKISHFLHIFVHEFHHENKRKEIMLYTVGKKIYSSTKMN